LNSIEQCFMNVRQILQNLPASWVELTTHRLDIYNEALAKSEFLEQLKEQLSTGDYLVEALEQLPTAYDYIRLGHQLSSILEWVLAELNGLSSEQVITFSSKTMPILAFLRRNALNGEPTFIYYDTDNSPLIDIPRLEQVYGYQVNLHKIKNVSEIAPHVRGSVIFVTKLAYNQSLKVNANVDVTVNIHPDYGSALFVHNSQLPNLVKDIQHVRRRETIAMTPIHALNVLYEMVNDDQSIPQKYQPDVYKPEVFNTIADCIKENTGSVLMPLIASSGLSIQYAIMMGLVENAMKQYPEKPIKIILPPNCYGGTNDQARRIAELIPNVGIVDLYVDGGQNLVASLEVVLSEVGMSDGFPIVLAEIPTNPRVEVPDMKQLGQVLGAKRKNHKGGLAVEPVFMVDQTFCPNVKLLHQQSELVAVKTISFSSGSKFPSGGRCIAGYCAANDSAKGLMEIISKHLLLSDNSAVPHQLVTLAENMPSMPDRIRKAYHNARQFVQHIQSVLPQSKIYFVSEEIASQGFTPSVFSLDLPATGGTKHERDENQKILNKKLIHFMITNHPNDCKNCVSYGQLKGCYWTIPATSTQGTTKEHDKDYVVRVALAPDVDVELLSSSFTEFCRLENLI